MTDQSSARPVYDITALTSKSAIAAAFMRMTVPALRLLAAGQPASVVELARAAGIPTEEAERTLRAFPDVEWDEVGRVTALGLTTRPTEHVVEFDGRTKYAWCALDTLVFAALLERPVVIRSRDPISGGLIRVEIDPSGGVAVTPPGAVVSWVAEKQPEEFLTVRATFCHHIHFFDSAETAAGWASDHPGGAVLSVPAAVEAARRLAAVFTGPTADRIVS
jgi:alkylmercury lyase